MPLGSHPPHFSAYYGFPNNQFFQYGPNVNGSHIRTANLGSNYQFHRFPNGNFGNHFGNQNAQTSLPQVSIAENPCHPVPTIASGVNSNYGRSNLIANPTSSVANSVTLGAQAPDVSVQALPPVTVGSNMNVVGDVGHVESNDLNVGNNQVQAVEVTRVEQNQGDVSVVEVENHDLGELSVTFKWNFFFDCF